MSDGALTMALAVYGKHPAKGDFLEHGLPPALKAPLEGWLDGVLAQARGELGTAWEQVWRDAPMLRFWIGEGVWGQPVVGVMAASQDRVGRRFPLVMVCTGGDAARVPAPTIGDDGGWYDRMAGHLAVRLAQRDLALPSDLIAGAAAPGELGTPEPGPDSFWAVRPGSAVAELLADIALTDHRRAAAGRSYWWVAGQDAPEPETAPLAEPDPAEAAAPAEVAQAEDAGPDLTAEPETAPETAPEADPAPERIAVQDAWNLPEPALPDEDDSPFASGGGLRLFAAPLAADPVAKTTPVVAPASLPPPLPRVLQSQVWAGSGLPNGQVLAWFLRGVTDNG